MIPFNTDPTFPYYMYGVHYFADTWSNNVSSFLSVTKDTRIPDHEGQLYLCEVIRIPGDSYG